MSHLKQRPLIIPNFNLFSQARLDLFGEYAARRSATALEELTLLLSPAPSNFHPIDSHRSFNLYVTRNLCSSAKDQLMGTSVAIKKIMKPFSTPVLSKRTYRELKLLKHIQHENVRIFLPVFRFSYVLDHSPHAVQGFDSPLFLRFVLCPLFRPAIIPGSFFSFFAFFALFALFSFLFVLVPLCFLGVP